MSFDLTLFALYPCDVGVTRLDSRGPELATFIGDGGLGGCFSFCFSNFRCVLVEDFADEANRMVKTGV